MLNFTFDVQYNFKLEIEETPSQHRRSSIWNKNENKKQEEDKICGNRWDFKERCNNDSHNNLISVNIKMHSLKITIGGYGYNYPWRRVGFFLLCWHFNFFLFISVNISRSRVSYYSFVEHA